jgi:hypothetical protein
MPKWIHDRADHLRRKNPEMPKSQSFAIATQQAHAAGKSPKKYGTPEGKREAKQKYDKPKGAYESVADPKTKTAAAMLTGFCDELEKIAAMGVPKTKLPGNVRMGATSIPREPPAPVPMTDVLAQTKMSPPPPVTAGR